MIDYERYPINQEGQRRDALLERVRSDLARDGCAVVKRFLTSKGVAALASEADSVACMGHRSFNRTNVYFSKDDPS
ncbi:MAG: hypothetical protein WBA92_12715, partial [Pseudorhodobacter sp.]